MLLFGFYSLSWVIEAEIKISPWKTLKMEMPPANIHKPTLLPCLSTGLVSPTFMFLLALLQSTGQTHGTHYFQELTRSVRALAIRKKDLLCPPTHTHTNIHTRQMWEQLRTHLQGDKYEFRSMEQVVICCLVWDWQLKMPVSKKKYKQFIQDVYHMFRNVLTTDWLLLEW